MWDSANTTAGWTSQLSFHEYPPHKPFINSTYRTLRPSATAALPESNRDHLFTALQSLTLRIKSLEKEREVRLDAFLLRSHFDGLSGGSIEPSTDHRGNSSTDNEQSSRRTSEEDASEETRQSDERYRRTTLSSRYEFRSVHSRSIDGPESQRQIERSECKTTTEISDRFLFALGHCLVEES